MKRTKFVSFHQRHGCTHFNHEADRQLKVTWSGPPLGSCDYPDCIPCCHPRPLSVLWLLSNQAIFATTPYIFVTESPLTLVWYQLRGSDLFYPYIPKWVQDTLLHGNVIKHRVSWKCDIFWWKLGENSIFCCDHHSSTLSPWLDED